MLFGLFVLFEVSPHSSTVSTYLALWSLVLLLLLPLPFELGETVVVALLALLLLPLMLTVFTLLALGSLSLFLLPSPATSSLPLDFFDPLPEFFGLQLIFPPSSPLDHAPEPDFHADLSFVLAKGPYGPCSPLLLLAPFPSLSRLVRRTYGMYKSPVLSLSSTQCFTYCW